MAHLAGTRTPTHIPIEDAELLLNTFNSPPTQPTPRHIGEWIGSVDGEMMDAAAVLLSARLLELQKRRYLNSRGGSPATPGGGGGSGGPGSASWMPSTLTTAAAYIFARPHHGRVPAYLPAIGAEDISVENNVNENADADREATTMAAAAAAFTSDHSQSDSGADSSDSSSESDMEDAVGGVATTNATTSAESSRAATPYRPSTPVISKHLGFQNISSATEYFPPGKAHHFVEPSPIVRPFRLSRLKRSRYESSEDEGPQHPSPSARCSASTSPSIGDEQQQPQQHQQHSAPTSAAKRRKPARAQAERVCSYCSTTTTPMWRHGPEGYNDLCNRCGVKYLRRRILQGNEE
ncbi:hypothetical protein HDU86_008277 [Geranomyces michiganensis]|nr:hypothetical protein HDU86_008277 [Geranomyces michiganensis]